MTDKEPTPSNTNKSVEIDTPEDWETVNQLTDDIVRVNTLLHGDPALLGQGDGPNEVFNGWSRSQLRRQLGDPNGFEITINPSDEDGRQQYYDDISLTIRYDKQAIRAFRVDKGYNYGPPINELDIPGIIERSLKEMLPPLKRELAYELIRNRSDLEKEDAAKKIDVAVELAKSLLSESEWTREPDVPHASGKPELKHLKEARKRVWPSATPNERPIELIERRGGKTSVKPRSLLDRALGQPFVVTEEWFDGRGYQLILDAQNKYNFHPGGHLSPTDGQIERVLAEMSINSESELLAALESLKER